jgi:hypothetical protein
MHLGVLYLDNLWVLFGRLFYRELGGGRFAIFFDRGWPQKYIIQKCMSDIYDVKVEVNSLVMCS